MAKKKPRPHPDDEADDLLSGRDPLGKLINQYHVSLAGLLIVCGVIAMVGTGLVIYAMSREKTSILFLAIGGFVLLMALALLGMNIFNVGRRLEVRKKGIRFVEAGIKTELFWDDIAAIDIDRTDSTFLGVASRERRSTDSFTPSGPLTTTEWDVTIRARDGRMIHLSRQFLKLVPDARKVINQMRMRAGL